MIVFSDNNCIICSQKGGLGLTTIDELEKLVNDYEERINELKRLEIIFDDLNTKGFEEDALSIKNKLKDPKAVKQVKKELDELKRKIEKGPGIISSDHEYSGTNDFKQRLNSLRSHNKDIDLTNIEKKLSNGELDEAERLLDEKEQHLDKFNTLSKDLTSLKTKIRKLTDRVADGELDSEAYKRALDDLEVQKKEIEEKIWKLRNELFKDDYEKPF